MFVVCDGAKIKRFHKKSRTLLQKSNGYSPCRRFPQKRITSLLTTPFKFVFFFFLQRNETKEIGFSFIRRQYLENLKNLNDTIHRSSSTLPPVSNLFWVLNLMSLLPYVPVTCLSFELHFYVYKWSVTRP